MSTFAEPDASGGDDVRAEFLSDLEAIMSGAEAENEILFDLIQEHQGLADLAHAPEPGQVRQASREPDVGNELDSVWQEEPDPVHAFVAFLIRLRMHTATAPIRIQFPLTLFDDESNVECGRVHKIWGRTFKATCRWSGHRNCTMMVESKWYPSATLAHQAVLEWLALGRSCTCPVHL